MKHTLIMTLALALVLGTTAIAETVEPAPTEIEAAAGVATEEREDQGDEKVEAVTEASATLEDALKALCDARTDACMESLKAELDGYVAAGKLTQEQADVILKQFSEKRDQRNGQRHNRRGGQENSRHYDSEQRGQQMPGGQAPQDGLQMPGGQMPQHGNRQMPGNQMQQQGGNQMPGNQMQQQGGNQMPGGQVPQQGGQQMPQQGGNQKPGNQMPDANSGATPQMPGNGQQGQQPRMGGHQMPSNNR